MAEAKLSQLQTLNWPRVASIDRPFLLFLIGLNGKIIYDVFVALEVATIQPLEYVSFALLWVSLGHSLYSYGLRQFRPRYRIWLTVTALYLLGLLIWGLFRNSGAYYFSQDLFALGYASAIFIGARAANWRIFDRMLVIHFAAISALTLSQLIAHRSSFAYESIIWTSLYLSWNLMYPWQYFLLTGMFGNNRRRVIATAGVILFVVLVVLFQKRTPVLILGVLVFAALVTGLWKPAFVMLKRRNVLVPAVGASAAALVFILLINPSAADTVTRSIGNLKERFVIGGSVETAVERDPRFSTEGASVFGAHVPLAERIFGRGIGASIETLPEVSETGRSGVLHNGVANIALKGGYVLLGLGAIGLAMIARDLLWLRDRHAYVCAGLIAAAVLVSPFQTFLNTNPMWALNMACLGYLMSVSLRRHKERRPTPAQASE